MKLPQLKLFRRIRNKVYPRPKFIIGLRDPKGGKMPVRLVTDSFDHLKANIQKIDQRTVLYLAMRYGLFGKKVKAIAVFSPGLNEHVRNIRMAIAELATLVMQYNQSMKK